jgi:hypothetical protein
MAKGQGRVKTENFAHIHFWEVPGGRMPPG